MNSGSARSSMHSRADRSLSPRQSEIAGLVKSGMTSRQIGEALFIDPRTVDSHIEAICGKLGVRTRVEMVVALFESGSSVSAGPPANANSPNANLPVARTALVGRETEVADVIGMLAQNRLVTVTGAGGVGKTRIALAVGDALLGDTKGGVWLAELAPLTRGSFVAAAIARALGVRESPHRPLIETLVVRLKQKELVLLLDNCEHVIAEVAAIVDALLRSCPCLRILATSRESLRIVGEHTYRLPSLGTPGPDVARTLRAATATGYGAIALFAQRAQAIDRRFIVTDENAPIVAEICRRLDGIALAIELAAARVNILPLRALSAKLDGRLRILTGGDRSGLPRHQTMRALIDWSYDLLSAPEQRLFERLSVFAGGCTLEAALSVYADDPADELSALDVLTSLVDKSLVIADLTGAHARYGLSESSRQYAYEKLANRGEATTVTRRHALAYVDVAERMEREADVAPNADWFTRAESERDNWRAALHWTIETRGDVVLGQRLAGALRPVWTHFSIVEARRWLHAACMLTDARTPEKVIAHLEFAVAAVAYTFGEFEAALAAGQWSLLLYEQQGETLRATRARLLAGLVLAVLGRVAEAEPMVRSGLATARTLGQPALIGFALVAATNVCSAVGDLSGARAHAAESLDMYTAIGAERFAASVASGLAEAEFSAGNSERAVQIITTSLVALRRLSYTLYIPRGLNNLAAYLIASDRYAEARVHAREALDLARESEHDSDLAWALQHIVAIAVLSPDDSAGARDRAMAARLLGWVDARIAALGTSREYTEQHEYDRVLRALCDATAADTLASLMALGATLTLDQAVEAATSL